MNGKILLVFIVWLFFVASCTKKSDSSSHSPTQEVESLISEPDYDSMSAENKYLIAKKLAATLYKGISPEEFFNLTDRIGDIKPEYDNGFLESMREKLNTPLSVDEKYMIIQRINEKYVFDDVGYPQKILTMLFEFPLSKDYFNMWMAYFLANTILFSPALELESVDYIDTHRVFQRLYTMISEDRSIRDIAYEHMISQENWRRFRSPEDNTREMMEIFLRRFIDEEVPKASKACQNWYLTDDTQGYSLVIDFNENTEPQDVLDTWVTNCYEFYRAIVEHKDFMPTIVGTIVRYLFSSYSEDKQKEITEAVLSKNPVTFRDVFTLLLFSREYLLNVERPKYFEELFFSTAHSIKWKPSAYFFKNIYHIYWKPAGWSSLQEMKQAPLTYKLGREPVLPLDYLSFAYYHKGVRDLLMIKRSTDEFSPYDYGWKVEFIDNLLEGEEFIHYIFLSTLGRRATQKEVQKLTEIFNYLGYEESFTSKDERALIILDYISRLPEFYVFKAIK